MQFLRDEKDVLVGAVADGLGGHTPVVWAAAYTIGFGLVTNTGHLGDTGGMTPDEAEQLGHALVMLAQNKRDNSDLSGVGPLMAFERTIRKDSDIGY